MGRSSSPTPRATCLGNTAGLGLYHADTRHLSGYDFTLRNLRPVLLTSNAELGFAQEQVLTNPNMIGQGGKQIERQTIEMRRVRAISKDIVEETLRVTNFNIFPITIDLLYRFEADFADIFEVRGYPRESSGRRLATRTRAQSIQFRYKGVDDRSRVTNIELAPRPIELTETHALHRVTLSHLESAVFTLEIHFRQEDEPRHETVSSHFREVAADHNSWFADVTTVDTDNQLFNAVLRTQPE